MVRLTPGSVRTVGALFFAGALSELGCTLSAYGEGGSPDSASAAGAGGSQLADAAVDQTDANGGWAGDLGPPDTIADTLQDLALDEGVVEACQPWQCTDLNVSCGDVDNGCGEVLHCGSCGPGKGCHANACAAVVYVAQSAPPGGKGSSWADAFNTIADALTTKPAAGTEIWVAKGTYTPTPKGVPIVVTLIPGVSLYGHFAGTEQALEERNLHSPDVSVLDGEGTSRVVEAASSTTLDGFTVQNGKSDQGAGIHALSVQDLRLANCVVVGNSSAGSGGGVYVGSSTNITITNTEVRDNTAGPTAPQGEFGGGIFLASSSSTIEHCRINWNTSGNGGGLCVQGGKAEVSATWFEGNAGTANGQAGTGAAHNMSLDGTTAYTNCLFVSNKSAGYGGAIYNSSSSPRIVNCTFWGNTAALGQGLDVFDNPGNPVIVNSILASGGQGKWAISDHPELGVKTAQVSYSDVVGEALGGSNIDVDPGFVNAGSGDFHLSAGSQCIDVGDPASAPKTDYAGNSRDSKPDLGALEHKNP